MFLLQKTGVTCPSCGQRLLILQSRVVAANFAIVVGAGALLSWALHSPLNAWIKELKGWETAAVIVLALAPFILIMNWLTPRFLQVRPIRDGEVVNFPVDNGQTGGI
jgi:hypothetical protein